METNAVERNKAVMRYIVECNDAQNFYGYVDNIAEDFVGHHHFMPEGLHGKTSVSDFFATLEGNSFPDGRHVIHHLFGEGDLVTLNLSLTGTFTKDLPNGIPANNKQITFDYNILTRFADDKVAEMWWFAQDSVVIMRDLGII